MFNRITSSNDRGPSLYPSEMDRFSRKICEKTDNSVSRRPKDNISHSWQRVMRRTVGGAQVKITLESGETRTLHRFALVGLKDRVRPGPASTLLASVPNVSDDSIVVSPAWQRAQTVGVCGRKLNIITKEIETPEELAGYEALTQHHYRTGISVGRRAIIIAKIATQDLPSVVGFVEVSSCFLVCVPRKKILDIPFEDSERGIKWERWDIETAKRYTNSTARISRCVVYPEVRGVGIAGILADAARDFTTERWHIGGLRPSFLEITAEMLRYWPFVEKAGFVKVGETEGNGNRLEKSMMYLLGRKKENRGFPKGGGGILTMHRAHATLLERTMEKRGWSVEDILAQIKKSPENLSVEDWVTLHGIYRRPKPVYMLGLTIDARRHLRERLSDDASDNELLHPPSNRAEVRVLVKEITTTASCEPDNSREARQIQEAFNIVSERLDIVITKDMDMDLRGGEIVLVTGASGSGKSLLLSALAWHASGHRKTWKLASEIQSRARVDAPFVKVGTLVSPPRNKSSIALLLALGMSLDSAMRLLASAGLGEAQLFVRPSKTLSSGQRYRLSLALALAKKPDLLLIDGFCESLDIYSATAVCRRLRREVERRGIVAIVATTDGDRVLSELRPQRVLQLLPNANHRWINHNEKHQESYHEGEF